jgi:two-component system CheB/CheR fusion protein
LAQPFNGNAVFKSVLATPVTLASPNTGLLVACSTEVSHWTEEQFRVIEWVAGQCGLVMETLQSQKALTEHAKALEAANHSKDRFLAMLSHELRTPLTPVLATAGMLESDARLPEDVREDFRMIRRNVGIQSKLIDDLLDLTRISRGKIELDRQILPVTVLLRDTVNIVAGDVDAKSQNIKLELSSLDNYAVIGDGPRLQQVFWNLLKNAIKFSEPGATIVMRGRFESNQVVVEVSDSGSGINPEDLDRIFLPFEQTDDKPRNANVGGLGLGLAIAKAIVEMHGGKLSAKSGGKGCGATFIVKLSAAANRLSPPQSPPADAPLNGMAANKSPHILLVEDHGDTGRVLARLLRTSGYQVEHAETAAAAMRLFEEKNFDLVVSDLGLPDESGLELMRRLRGLRPDLRGICLSGYGMEQDVAECLNVGFREHLTKPIEINRLKAAISKVMAG